jgi:Ca2+-binding EF-hand superfamily protein
MVHLYTVVNSLRSTMAKKKKRKTPSTATAKKKKLKIRARYRAAFEAIDANKDGVLTTKELHTAMDAAGIANALPTVVAMMSEADASEDDVIDFNEFANIMDRAESYRTSAAWAKGYKAFLNERANTDNDRRQEFRRRPKVLVLNEALRRDVLTRLGHVHQQPTATRRCTSIDWFLIFTIALSLFSIFVVSTAKSKRASSTRIAVPPSSFWKMYDGPELATGKIDLASLADADGDGDVTAAELTASLEKHCNPSPKGYCVLLEPWLSPHVAQEIIKKHDANGNGKLDGAELAVATPAVVEAIIAQSDMSKKNGELDEEELGKANADEKKIIEEIDTNNDGKLDGAELNAAPRAREAKTLVDKFDMSKKDGKLDGEELAALNAELNALVAEVIVENQKTVGVRDQWQARSGIGRREVIRT